MSWKTDVLVPKTCWPHWFEELKVKLMPYTPYSLQISHKLASGANEFLPSGTFPFPLRRR